MNVTAVTPEDNDTLKEIARRAILISVQAEEPSKLEIISDTEKHIEQNSASNNCVFLKHESTQTTGFILIQGFWNLSDLYVTPEKHGEGIGSLLLNKAISTCEKYNDKGYIRVNSSTNAARFYRKQGFVAFAPQKETPDFVVPLIYRF